MAAPLTNLSLMRSVCAQLPDQAAREKFWNESLTLSIASLTASIARFKKAIADHDAEELSHASHKIVGTISFVGVQALSDRLAMLQDDCDEKRVTWPFTEEEFYLAQFEIISHELEEAKKNPPV
jgi:HPt (histidine-containing phosphotransfer) domain-containing protein